MHKKHKHKIAEQQGGANVVTMPIPAPAPDAPRPSILSWVLSSIVFSVFAGSVAPAFLHADLAAKSAGSPTATLLLGILGILTFFIEPVVLAIYMPAEKEDAEVNNDDVFEGRSLTNFIDKGIFYALILPRVVFLFFRPLFRTLLLGASFSFLNLPVAHSPIFIVLAGGDLLLYYLNMWMPNLIGSPARGVVQIFNIQRRPVLMGVGSVLFIFYSAFVFAFWCSIGYSETGHVYLEGEQLTLILFSWLFATLYTRMPFMTDDMHTVAAIKKLPTLNLVAQLVALVISFVAYTWPYFSAAAE